jgi:hypothetical protein
MIPVLAAAVLLGVSPEDRALAYLAREVPSWSAENKCYSCHNNGDAARALYVAARLGRSVPAKALADTTRWLSRPDGWDNNGGEGPSNDRKLARLQFAASLTEAVDAGLIKERKPLEQAAERLAADQHKDGSWHALEDGILGSPATHGNALATHFARRTLLRADARKHEAAIAKADAWLRKTEVKAVLDAAAVLLALEKADDDAAVTQRRQCLALIRKGEAKDGGWGPYVHSRSEVFDTALVLLALARQPASDETKAMLQRGRAYLLAAQQRDGSWQATTRPSGGESYAQQLSTTGWATRALLEVRDK